MRLLQANSLLGNKSALLSFNIYFACSSESGSEVSYYFSEYAKFKLSNFRCIEKYEQNICREKDLVRVHMQLCLCLQVIPSGKNVFDISESSTSF